MYEDTNWKQTNPVVQDLQNESAQKNQRSTGQFWSCCFPPGAHNLKMKDTPKILLEMRNFARNARCFCSMFFVQQSFWETPALPHKIISWSTCTWTFPWNRPSTPWVLRLFTTPLQGAICTLSQLFFGGVQNTSPLDFVKTIWGRLWMEEIVSEVALVSLNEIHWELDLLAAAVFKWRAFIILTGLLYYISSS